MTSQIVVLTPVTFHINMTSPCKTPHTFTVQVLGQAFSWSLVFALSLHELGVPQRWALVDSFGVLRLSDHPIMNTVTPAAHHALCLSAVFLSRSIFNPNRKGHTSRFNVTEECDWKYEVKVFGSFQSTSLEWISDLTSLFYMHINMYALLF